MEPDQIKTDEERGTVLVTGASGLVGSRLIGTLKNQGYNVKILSRNGFHSPFGQVYTWNIENKEMELEALNGVDSIIHLAGAGVAEKRWSKKRKQEIWNSRTDSTRLLMDSIAKTGVRLKSFVSASAIGYYGHDSGDKLCFESSQKGQGFLSDVVRAWEEKIFELKSVSARVVAFRIGLVLANDGGALPKMTKPIQMFVGAPLGSGNQYMSWIHIDDLVRMFLSGVQKPEYEGIYNAVAPAPVTNKQLTEEIAKVLSKPLILPNIPGVMLRLILGEMGSVVLGGNKVSPDRIMQNGFEFKYSNLKVALQDCLVDL